MGISNRKPEAVSGLISPTAGGLWITHISNKRADRMDTCARPATAPGWLGEWSRDHPPAYKPDVSRFDSSGFSTVLRGSGISSVVWWAMPFRFLLGPCHGYLQHAGLGGTVTRCLGVVAITMEELAILQSVATLLRQWLDVVDLADLVHGLKQSSAPSTPPALPFEQDCLAGG